MKGNWMMTGRRVRESVTESAGRRCQEEKQMSFSEKVTAANKSEAKLAVIDAMNKIVARDPAHARDQKVILSNVGATIDLLHDDYTKDVVVCFSGAIGWTGSADPAKFEITSSSMGCSAYYVPRAA